MNVEWINPALLIPYPGNAKQHPPEQVDHIANSIKRFGWQQPIVADKANVVVIGHGRLMAAKQLMLDSVPVIYADRLTDEEINALRLADNKTNESGWDFDRLEQELAQLAIDGIDMTAFGFEDLQGELPTEDTAEPEAPDLPTEPKAKLGDMYRLGNHVLLCGDSTSVDNLRKLIGGASVDMVYTDPPYGMNLDTDFSGMESKIANGGNKYDAGAVDDFAPEMVDTVFAVDAEEVFLWGADYYAELIPDRNDGSWIVWDKRANGNDDAAEDYASDKMYGSCFELCWSKRRHKRDIARIKWAGVFGMEQEFDHKRVHPTQKPIKLAAWFIERYSKQGATILDLFGGSGSTLLACEQTGRKCLMCELDPHYVDVIIARWEKMTGQQATRIEERAD